MSSLSSSENKEIIECPICYDPIEDTKNKVITECGHCFHTGCLMTNAAHNGFGCPFCRTKMAVEPECSDEEDDDDEYTYVEEDAPAYDSHILRSARWFFQRVEGEEMDDSDDSDTEEEEFEENELLPSATYVSTELTNAGITMEDMVKYILLNSFEDFENEVQYASKEMLVYGHFRRILSMYEPPEV